MSDDSRWATWTGMTNSSTSTTAALTAGTCCGRAMSEKIWTGTLSNFGGAPGTVGEPEVTQDDYRDFVRTESPAKDTAPDGHPWSAPLCRSSQRHGGGCWDR